MDSTVLSCHISTDIATDKAFCFLGSGSHLNSIQMVLTKQAEAAAIDANALACNKKYLQDEGKDVQVLHSIGPLPPYPVVVNNRLDSEYNGCWQEAMGPRHITCKLKLCALLSLNCAGPSFKT
jgi:ABC-type phosphate/phosphonate transport system substrate-binding protein